MKKRRPAERTTRRAATPAARKRDARFTIQYGETEYPDVITPTTLVLRLEGPSPRVMRQAFGATEFVALGLKPGRYVARLTALEQGGMQLTVIDTAFLV